MKKHFANIITSLRIIGSIALLFFSFPSQTFYGIYLFCGLSDMIDGALARKLNAVSSFGSKLDTIADIIFMAVCVVKILPMINLSIWLWIWIILIAIIKVFNIVLGFTHKKKFENLHTVLNKITGLLLFLLPITLKFIEPTYSFATVCTIATFAATQESYYIIKANDK